MNEGLYQFSGAFVFVFIIMIMMSIIGDIINAKTPYVGDREYIIRIDASVSSQTILIQDSLGEMNKKLDSLLEHFKDTKIIHAEEVKFSHDPEIK